MEVLSAAEWRAGSVERCRRALLSARASGDRLALVRSLARLQDGRTDLPAENIRLSPDELSLLARFGLAISGNFARILDEQDDCAPDGFRDAYRLDSAPRVIQPGASPDAVLLRHTSHQTYNTAAQKA